MKKLVSAYNLDTVPAVQWGVVHENTALSAYKALGGQVAETGNRRLKFCSNALCVELVYSHSSYTAFVIHVPIYLNAGIWLHESGELAASPDGLVVLGPTTAVHGNVTGSPKLVEIKCPYSARDMTVAEAAVAKADFCLGNEIQRLLAKFAAFEVTAWH